jgi:RHS repeat-associated protein
MAKANPLRFSTKYQDDESDLLYYSKRYYKSSTGTWLSRDPIEEDGGDNVYEFVNNDPISYVDKFGLQVEILDPIVEEPILGPTPVPVPVPTPVPPPVPTPTPTPTPIYPPVPIIPPQTAPPVPPTTCSVCPACTPYAVGTVGYLGPHKTKPSAPPGAPRPDHYNLFVVNQQKAPGCHCFWNRYPPHYWKTQGPATVNLNSGFPTLSP